MIRPPSVEEVFGHFVRVGGPMRFPRFTVTLQRRCPRCSKGSISKTGQHRSHCDACGQTFIGLRIGFLRLGFAQA